jgi:uncharacterized membrane protein YbhN (UPF0104 family)
LGWGVLTLFKRRPIWANRFVSLFGKGGAGRFVAQGLSGVLENMSPRRLAWLTISSLSVWYFYGTQTILGVNAVAGLALSWDKAISVSAVSGLGMLLPSSPGAIGVYEAFTVTVLKSYGVGAEEALALALFSHMAQFIPVTLAGGLVCLFFPKSNRQEVKK